MKNSARRAMFSKIKYKDINGKIHHVESDSFVTQTILFDKEVFTADQAKTWLKHHEKADFLDIKKEVIRARQVSPTKFAQLHTKEIEKGIQIVGGKLKP